MAKSAANHSVTRVRKYSSSVPKARPEATSKIEQQQQQQQQQQQNTSNQFPIWWWKTKKRRKRKWSLKVLLDRPQSGTCFHQRKILFKKKKNVFRFLFLFAEIQFVSYFSAIFFFFLFLFFLGGGAVIHLAFAFAWTGRKLSVSPIQHSSHGFTTLFIATPTPSPGGTHRFVFLLFCFFFFSFRSFLSAARLLASYRVFIEFFLPSFYRVFTEFSLPHPCKRLLKCKFTELYRISTEKSIVADARFRDLDR